MVRDGQKTKPEELRIRTINNNSGAVAVPTIVKERLGMVCGAVVRWEIAGDAWVLRVVAPPRREEAAPVVIGGRVPSWRRFSRGGGSW
jgi:hypothetical protein